MCSGARRGEATLEVRAEPAARPQPRQPGRQPSLGCGALTSRGGNRTKMDKIILIPIVELDGRRNDADHLLVLHQGAASSCPPRRRSEDHGPRDREPHATADQVTARCCRKSVAVSKRCRVECATITPDEARYRGVRVEGDVPLSPKSRSATSSVALPRADRDLERAAARPGRPHDLGRHGVRRPVPGRERSRHRRGQAPTSLTFTPKRCATSPVEIDVYAVPRAAASPMATAQPRRLDPRLCSRLDALRAQPQNLSTS